MRTQTTAQAMADSPMYQTPGYGMGIGMGMGMGSQPDSLDQMEYMKIKMKQYNFIGKYMIMQGDVTVILVFFILWIGLAIGCIFTKLKIKEEEENIVISACKDNKHDEINLFSHPKIIGLLVASYLCAILSMGCFGGFIMAVGLAF